MLKKLPFIAAICVLTTTTQAQTVSDFENSFGRTESSYLEGFTTDSNYYFTSGNIKMMGQLLYGGTYLTGFNYSNRTNDSVGNWSNMWSSVTAGGYESDHYMIAYLESDYNNFNVSQVFGAPILNNGANNYVSGFQLANSTYAYYWMKENLVAGDSVQLIVSGYNNDTFTNNVTIPLAKITNIDTAIVKMWEWVDLTPLNKIDSITFQMVSTNPMTPFYFVMDNFTTTDGVCPDAQNALIEDVANTTANLNFHLTTNSFLQQIEVAIDTTGTPEPHAATTTVLWDPNINYNFNNLLPQTTYTAHYRTVCDGSLGNWKHITFTTGGVSIPSIDVYEVALYPNPTTGKLFLQGSNNWTNAMIYSIQGQLIEKIDIVNNELNIEGLTNGMYIIKLIGKDKQSHPLKITKQ